MLPPFWTLSLWLFEMPVLLAGHPVCLDSTVWDFEVKAVEAVVILGRGVLPWTRLSLTGKPLSDPMDPDRERPAVESRW